MGERRSSSVIYCVKRGRRVSFNVRSSLAIFTTTDVILLKNWNQEGRENGVVSKTTARGKSVQRYRAAARGLDAELVGISVDPIWCHQAFAKTLRLRFPLLSDAHPRGAAACADGVYRPRHGTSERALVVIDRTGLIRWRYLAPPDINPGIDGMLTALEALAAGEESA